MEMKESTRDKVHVLVVEDEVLVRMSTVMSLGELGFATLEAASGDEALHILERHPEIQVVFTDIQMPGALDGVGLAQMVRSRWPKVSVVICSARVLPPTSSLPDGVRFIAKPYYFDELRDMTKTWAS